MAQYFPPQLAEEEFNCPHCGVYAQQIWFQVTARLGRWRWDLSEPPPNPYTPVRPKRETHYFELEPVQRYEGGKPYGIVVDRKAKFIPQSGNDLIINELYLSLCTRCERPTVWRNREMLFPGTAGIEPPNSDLSEEIRNDYNEAAAIVGRSPRGAAALLRLCLQKLFEQLQLPNTSPNEAIKELVKRGLNPDIQRALDTVRVVGNNAVHPGEIDLADTPEIALSIFGLINYIAEQMLTFKKKREEIFESLPAGVKEQIKRRDGNA